MKPRVYVETSVVRYLSGRLSHDIRVLYNQISTLDWWRHARESLELVASPLVIDDEEVRDHQLAYESRSALELLTMIHPSDASETLARQLTDSHALPEEASLETAHIAIAVANGVEYLATWNVRHIANPANASKINLVCREGGYRPTVICTPAQLEKLRDDGPRDDPLIAQIREYRDRQAARFGCDAAAIIRHYRALHEASGRPSVQYPPRRLEATSASERADESRAAVETAPSSPRKTRELIP